MEWNRKIIHPVFLVPVDSKNFIFNCVIRNPNNFMQSFSKIVREYNISHVMGHTVPSSSMLHSDIVERLDFLSLNSFTFALLHFGNCHIRAGSREVSKERSHLKATFLSYPQQSKMNSIMRSLTALFFMVSQLQLCTGFVQIRTRALMKPIAAFDFNSIIVTAIEVAEKADDYQYGAVAAPAWALPLGAVLVIATAAIPVLLKPGEEV